MKLRCKKSIIFFTILQFFIVAGVLPSAQAALISTHTMIESETTASAEETREQLRQMLNQEEVTAELVKLGVDPVLAEERIAALTPAELQQFQENMDELPAGAGGFFEVLGITFLVLIILDLVGITNIFTVL